MQFIKTEFSEAICVIRVSRPEALNALSSAVLDELELVLQDVCQKPEIRGIILTGDGEKAFVAGADIRELASLSEEKALNLAQKGQDLFKSIEDCPKPVVAVINGFALGGGCELAMACHLRIATESARLGQPEVNLGIIPGFGGTQRLAQLTGRARAIELILTGDIISAQEAFRIGLINRVVKDQAEAMDAARQLLGKVATKGPLAVAQVIRSVNAGYSFEDAGYQTEAKAFGKCASTKDFKEGTSAFLEKRAPRFTGE